MNSWTVFSAFYWLWKHFPCKKLSRWLNKWQSVGEIRWIWQMRQNFTAQFIQLLKRWLYRTWSGVVENILAPSVDQCRLQGLQFLVHLINLLSILPRCNGFTRIQETLVDQTGRRPPSYLFWCKFGFGKCFGASQSNLRAGHHWLS